MAGSSRFEYVDGVYICLMVQQKIIVKVQMNCGKCRTKAMKIAAVAEGMPIVFSFSFFFVRVGSRALVISNHLLDYWGFMIVGQV